MTELTARPILSARSTRGVRRTRDTTALDWAIRHVVAAAMPGPR